MHQSCPIWHDSCVDGRIEAPPGSTSSSCNVLNVNGTGIKETTIMDTRQLGTTDLHITPIGFGAWAIGGSGWAFAWGTQDGKDSIAAIRTALDTGINWIDTAAVYGLGHSEEIV